jgi:hypothetical protein
LLTRDKASLKPKVLKMKAHRKMMAVRHSEELKARGRKELGFLLIFCALILYALCAIRVKGF